MQIEKQYIYHSFYSNEFWIEKNRPFLDPLNKEIELSFTGFLKKI